MNERKKVIDEPFRGLKITLSFSELFTFSVYKIT